MSIVKLLLPEVLFFMKNEEKIVTLGENTCGLKIENNILTCIIFKF